MTVLSPTALAPPALAQTPAAAPRYLDASAPVEVRVEDLLGRLTLVEKIGQMTQLSWQFVAPEGGYAATRLRVDDARVREAVGTYGVGAFLNGYAATAEEWVAYLTQLQRTAMDAHRLRIPMLYGVDHVHGANYLAGATVFPQQLNLAATFDTTLARRMGEVTARETAALGHHWNFAPILDLGRNARWSRFYETFGESPYAASALGAAYVRGLQGTRVGPYRVAATMKHFLAYSDPRSGWDRTPVEVPDQVLYEAFLPPFRAALAAGAQTVMVNSAEINGEPVHASRRLLTTLLREEMGFDGVIVTDWEDIGKLVQMHRVAADEKEATRLAVEAGVDMSMVPMSLSFPRLLRELVDEGRLPEARIDASVRRVLRLKFTLGLFEHPFPTLDHAALVGAADHRASARAAAQASLVLLKNGHGPRPRVLADPGATGVLSTNGALSPEAPPIAPAEPPVRLNGGGAPVLPLRAGQRVLVAGPHAHAKRPLSGGWTLEWQGSTEARYPADMPTVYAALRDALGPSAVALGAVALGDATATAAFAAQAARADVVVLVLGEDAYAEQVGNYPSLALPDSQTALVRAAYASGTPVVAVYLGGRPRPVAHVLPYLDAFVWAGLPGLEGGSALADVLTGAASFSGKLPFDYPAGDAHYAPHNHKPSEYHLAARPDGGFAFGEGLQYTTYAYTRLALSDTTVAPGRAVTARVTVQNTGTRPGTEPVLWFLTDVVGRVTRPVRELRHMERVALAPGESRTLTFIITPDAMQYPDATGQPVLEPGAFVVSVGGLAARFTVR